MKRKRKILLFWFLVGTLSAGAIATFAYFIITNNSKKDEKPRIVKPEFPKPLPEKPDKTNL